MSINVFPLIGANKWNTSTIQYRTNLTTWDYDTTGHSNITVSPAANPLESGDVTYLTTAMGLWRNLVKIDFQSTIAAIPDILFRESDDITVDGDDVNGYVAGPVVINGIFQHQDIVIDSERFTGQGTAGFMTPLHELGHVLGLRDVGDVQQSGYLGTRANSLMAEEDLTVSTPMIYDIAAIHQMYPTLVNHDYNAGSTVYDSTAITGAAKTWTLWDGGGAADSINLTSQTTALKLDLRGGPCRNRHAKSDGKERVISQWVAFYRSMQPLVKVSESAFRSDPGGQAPCLSAVIRGPGAGL